MQPTRHAQFGGLILLSGCRSVCLSFTAHAQSYVQCAYKIGRVYLQCELNHKKSDENFVARSIALTTLHVTSARS